MSSAGPFDPAKLEVEPAQGGPERARSPSAPVLRASGFLRVTAVVSALATAFGLLLIPAITGIAGNSIVAPLGALSSSLAYFMCGLLVAATILACVELSRASRMSLGPRIVAIGASGAVVAFSLPALFIHLPISLTLAMSLAAVLTAFAGAWEGMRADRTRAIAGVVGAFALAALLRLGAWEVATVAGDRASVRLYAVGRGVATAAVVLEGLGQMVAAAWLGTRSRRMGQLLSSLAIAVAFVLTWGAARGASAIAEDWQAGLHTALAGAPGVPPPFALSALATFFVSAAILLALVSAVQPRQVSAIVCALALTLIGRGAFDVPLRALASTAGALWLMVALVDKHAMWKSLLAQRERQREEAGQG